MLELFFRNNANNGYTYTALIDRQNQFSIFNFLNLYSGFLASSVDPDQPASSDSVCHTTYAVLHNLVDMRKTCFHMYAKIASNGNFYLLFGENY